MDPVVHFEMAYQDRQRAADFYSKTFGWKTQMLGAEMNDYVVVHTGETSEDGMLQKPGMINGGLYQKPEDPQGQAPSVVIAVEDIEETLKKIEANGGKILGQPMPIPGVGKYASFIDTEGNRASVLQPDPMKQ
jgi:predicted enzyme related to lactoylglutathione lyase